ncbi:hypothetical protein [Sphaerisporangium perillae]|uniref:hypothetical protein n=1 Tax=Sphaerisporangium perillae TaxID=2935860 RepID=UPI0020102658|nr:hypothetical protein [Sphaerisporangium perillae]
MSDQNPDETGVFPPPAAEPSWFTPSKRPPRPDARVWPPAEAEPRATSTVPIPVIADRPLPRRQAWPTPPPGAPYDGPPYAAPAPAPPAGGAPFGGAPFGGAPFGVPAGFEAEHAGAAQPARRRRRAMPKAAKIGLQFFGAVALAAAFLGVRGYDAIHRFEADSPPAQVRQVAKGRQAPLGDAKWRLEGIALATQQSPDTPDRVMLQIDLEATALNDKAKNYAFSPPGAYLADKSGRTWLALVSESPQDLKPGVPARFTLLSAVPKGLADQVELVLWPGDYQGKNQSGPSLRFDR